MACTIQVAPGTNITLDDISESAKDQIGEHLLKVMGAAREKKREACAEALWLAIDLCPNANFSDVWHHIIYRKYLSASSPQSWVRTSGEGFELFLCQYYNALLGTRGLRFTPLFLYKDKGDLFKALGISVAMGGSKLDIAVHWTANPKTNDNWQPLGGIHAKVSLAERVSDDVPASQAMMKSGFWSPLCTLDVKSFPGEFVNNGELGTPERPSDKRRYIEEHGAFSACYSYNLRTSPSVSNTPSGSKLYTLTFRKEEDQLCRDALAERAKRLAAQA